MTGPLIALLLAASSFDLVCAGTISTVEQGKVSAKVPTKGRYRIDLDRGRYCTAKCTTSEPIYSVTSTEIVLRFQKYEDAGYVTKINREDGSYTDVFMLGDSRIVDVGKCERAPFSGLPERKF